ncbi:ATP phosphoribosyltransferase regulatory subunit [Stutzerimonas urumqiensis]|uniref:ATP phosphoribosyltransferase regulatory subunit n=1 Tax=Stutzerimonas urumqiensis TaxID=638269 RepID=UPI003DA3AFF1
MATVERWLLPDGIEEVLPPEAERIEQARRSVLDLFRRWGYELVITPHAEFLDSLLTGTGQELDLKTFKVVDPLSGRQMGLRADITPQVARIDAHTLRRQGPSRLCYAGSVLHAKPRSLATSRSPIQLGAELYGDSSASSDIEVICLMLETLELAGVEQVHMDLGHVGVYRGLAQAAGLAGEAEQRLFDALQRKAVEEVAVLTESLDASIAGLIRALARLCGGREVLDEAAQLLAEAPDAVRDALASLITIADTLAVRYPSLPLYFDLAELRGYHYHTGVVFAAFVPGMGDAIAQGGRYDDVGAAFGRARPATGFSTDLKSLVAYGESMTQPSAGGVWAPADPADSALWGSITELRGRGVRVVQALGDQSVACAGAAGCDHQLVRVEGAWQVVPLSA